VDVLDAALADIFLDPNLSVSGTITLPGAGPRRVRLLFTSVADRANGVLTGIGGIVESDTAEVLRSAVKTRPPRGTKLRVDHPAGRRFFELRAPADVARDQRAWVMSLTETDS
jgi:hypothetical protein